MLRLSRLGSDGCGDDSKDDGEHGEALGEDAPPHQELRLPGLPLVEGAEAVYQRSCCRQTTWRGGKQRQDCWGFNAQEQKRAKTLQGVFKFSQS